MFAAKFKTVLFTSILALSAASSHADVITFEGIAPVNYYLIYEADVPNTPSPGYALTASPVEAFVVSSGAFSGLDEAASNGTDYLAVRSESSVTLTSTAQSLFSVNSIDLANFSYDADPTIATLTGTFANGTTISKIFILRNNNYVSTNDFTTELLNGFVDLTSFNIAASGFYFLDVDNIVIHQTAATDVPEPASLAILGFGLVGIAAARRRKSA